LIEFIQNDHDEDDLIINDEHNYDAWVLMRATDFRYLPYIGGLLDQPESLLQDILTIEGEYQRLKQEMNHAG
jgi:hypothetical protein